MQLSTISSEALWEQTGRLSKIGSEVCSNFNALYKPVLISP